MNNETAMLSAVDWMLLQNYQKSTSGQVSNSKEVWMWHRRGRIVKGQRENLGSHRRGRRCLCCPGWHIVVRIEILKKIDPWIQLVPNLPGLPAGRSRSTDHRRDQNLPAGRWTAKKRLHRGLGFTNIEIKKEHLFRNKCLQSVRLNI